MSIPSASYGASQRSGTGWMRSGGIASMWWYWRYGLVGRLFGGLLRSLHRFYRRALAPGGGEDLVGVEGEDQPRAGKTARRLEQQSLPRALVVLGPGVVDERDLGVASRDLARPVGRALVRDDDVVGPQARAAQKA